MIRNITVILVAVLACAGAASAGSWSETFTFSPNAIEVRAAERAGRQFDLVLGHGDRFDADRSAVVSYTDEPGMPLLPSWTVTIVVPQGMSVVAVEAEPQAVHEFPGRVNVMPAQPPVPVSSRELPAAVEPDARVYASDAAWPGRYAEHGSTGSKSGFRLATVTLHPLQYHPATGRLELATRMTVRVRYEPDPAARRRRLTEDQLRAARPAVRALVANPADVARCAPRTTSRDWGNIDCVIITSSTLESAFAPLVEWRTRQGFRTEVRTTSWIYSNYSGRDNPERIRNFVIDYYDNQGLQWLVLGGDTNVVPCRRVRTYCAGETGNIPSDLYYADVDWSWDGDGDNIFGEYGQDTVDLYADLSVGRASVGDATQAQTFVNKAIKHDQSPPLDHLRRILLVDAYLWSGYNETLSNDSIASYLPSGWTARRIHRPPAGTMVRDSLNNGFQFAHLVGHGNDVGIYNNEAYYHNSMIAGHTNGDRVGLINSIACYPGNFEYSDCLAENSHNCPTGGALAVIFNSRYGWGTPPVLGPSEKLDMRFYDFLFNRDSLPLGLTHHTSKEAYRANAAAGDGSWRWCYFELNLFGDPLQSAYEDLPDTLVASFPASIATGSQTFTVTVGDDFSAVEGAVVCVWKGSEVYDRGFTNASGQASFTINPVTTGYLRVTASSPGYLPDIDSSQVLTAPFDVGVTRIIAPDGMIDSTQAIAPSCSVYNHGSNTVSYTVRMTVGSGYARNVTVTNHAPGTRLRVIFPPDSAWPRGNLAVACSTRLAGDVNNSNDRLTGSVFSRVTNASSDSIIRPRGTVLPGSVVTPRARFRNQGNTAVTMNVHLKVSDGYWSTKTVSDLAPGATTDVDFDNWTAATPGNFTVTCTTRLAGDIDNSDDRLMTTVAVRDDDVGVTHLLAPAGTVDSGTVVVPACSVYNHGTSTAGYDVRLTVGSFYDQTVTVAAHLPGTRRYVTFPSHSAWPRGNHAVACSTRLAGDTDNSNDRLGGSVSVRVPDVGVSHLLAPSGALDSGDVVTPACSVYNHGTTSESYSVRMRIGTGYSQAAAVNNHLPGTRRYVTFANWTAGAPGTYPVRCSTELALDLVRANDRLTDTVTVGSYDVGCYRVAAPTGTADSGATVTPAAWVRNHGTQPVANLPVIFRIGSVYADTQQVTSLPPGDSAQITFANWTAVPGNWTAACTTRLAGDRNPGNDRASQGFFVQYRDVAVLAVAAPSQADSGTAVVPTVTVANRGNTSENATFRLTISGTGYTETVSRLLAPGPGTDTLTFPAWTAGPRGNRVLACSTLLAGDMNQANNRALDTTFVRVLDVAATRVIAPTGTVDSVASLACQARVRNRGNTTVSFPLSFLVMGGDTAALNGNATNLAPGDSTVVTVGNWTVGPPGTYRTRVTTGLGGDMVPGNNIVADSFVVRAHDVAAVAILEPAAVVDTGASVPVRAVVANNGGGPENAIVFVTISGTSYRDSTFASLAPGGQDTVTLDNWSVVAQRGPHTVTCSTWVAGDAIPANDTARRAVSVRVRDVGVVQILAPSGAVDSGVVVTPWARIRNHGTDPETFPVRFTISDGYSSTRTLALGPGLDTVLTFDQWTANTIGYFETRCTTMLGTDIRHANDVVSGTVRVIGNDAGITEIIAPVGGIEPGPVVPACRVQNFGAQARDLVAWARVSDAADSVVYFDSVALAGLAPDSSAVLEFGEWTVPEGGYTVRCSSWTANDHNPANDTLSASCFTLIHDVGMTAIISPLGRMDPVTVSPVARVLNNGSAAESFWCHFRIEDSIAGTVVYRDSVFTVDLGPGATRVERFAAWTAHVGRFRHTGWTRLDGDAEPANDTARASVVVTPGAAGWEIRNDLPGGPEMRVVKHGGCLVGVETDRPVVYALKGNKCGEFYAYDVLSGTWQQLPGIPDGPIQRQVRGGADLCYDGAGHIYALKGNNTLEFWRYDLTDSSWNALPDVPAGARKLKYGSALAHISRDDSSWIYCLKGSKTFEFYAFSVEANVWVTMPSAPAGPSGKPYKSGSVMRTDGEGNLYILKGRYNEFFKADARTCEWVMHPPMPSYGVSGKRNKAKDGADLAWDGRGTLYGFGGGNRPFFFAFVDSANRWVELESLPHGPSGRRVKHGGSVAVVSKRVWALKGNKTLEFWSYTPDTFLLFGARPDRSGAADDPVRVPRWTGDFLVGPSPAREELVVRAAPGAGRAMVELVSPAGRVERSAALPPGGRVRFGLGDIAAGTWFVRIRTADLAETRKIIISP